MSMLMSDTSLYFFVLSFASACACSCAYVASEDAGKIARSRVPFGK